MSLLYYWLANWTSPPTSKICWELLGNHQSICQLYSHLHWCSSIYLVAVYHVGLLCHEPPCHHAAQLLQAYGSIDWSDTWYFSHFLLFWESVYYIDPSDDFHPSATDEKLGCFIGIAELIGDAMTYKVLMDNTKKIIYYGTVCSALISSECNLHLPHLDSDDSKVPPIIW